MNYYERIQKSIDFVEANLDDDITIEMCAKEAFMSVSGYYRMFLSIVGYNVKEYIRLRRLTLACVDIQQTQDSVMTIAVKYLYNSADSFSRAFKKQFGVLPSQMRSSSANVQLNQFERMNIMEQYFDTEDKDLLEKYPDIKIIRELPDMKAACFTYFGPDPEDHAYEVLKEWVHKNQISLQDSAYRIFGYNHPDPSDVDADELYGYEVCVTIPDALYQTLDDVPKDFVKGTYDTVKRRVIQGGKYAVLSVKRDDQDDIGINIMKAWKRFTKWLEEGKYIWGGRQYLEEHLGFSEDDDHIGGVELYMPIEKAPKLAVTDIKEEVIPACRVAMFKMEGENADKLAEKCWEKALTWAKDNCLNNQECRIFQFNKGFDRRPPLFHAIMITLPEWFDEDTCLGNTDSQRDDGRQFTFYDFPGGKYMTVDTKLEHLMETWKHMEQWRKETKTAGGSHQWVEEWVLDNWSFPYRQIKVCYPIV